MQYTCLCVTFVESIVQYSPLSCISDHPSVPSPCMPPRTPDGFALPSVGSLPSVKTLESVNEAVLSAESDTHRVSPKLQKTITASTVIERPSHSAVNDVVGGDNGLHKVANDSSRSAVTVASNPLTFSMMNVFDSEEQKKQVIDDVST